MFRSLSFLIIALPFVATEDVAADEYRRGMADAIIRHVAEVPDVAAVSFDSDGAILLTAKRCIRDGERARIERALAKAEVSQQVRWQQPFDGCIKEGSESSWTRRAVWEEEGALLSTREVFPRLLADPQEPRTSLRYQYHHRGEARHIGAVSAGDAFPLVDWRLSQYETVQLGLEGGVFSIFDLDSDSFDLINTDFVIGVPLAYRDGAFAARARLFHQSSHLGDEFLLENPGVERVNFSYEALELLLAYGDEEGVRIFGGGGALLRSEPSLDRLYTEFGAEYRRSRFVGGLDLVVASYFGLVQALDWDLNQSYQIGLALREVDGRELRFMFEFYNGYSPNGQFFEERVEYVGAGFFFDL